MSNTCCCCLKRQVNATMVGPPHGLYCVYCCLCTCVLWFIMVVINIKLFTHRKEPTWKLDTHILQQLTADCPLPTARGPPPTAHCPLLATAYQPLHTDQVLASESYQVLLHWGCRRGAHADVRLEQSLCANIHKPKHLIIKR